MKSPTETKAVGLEEQVIDWEAELYAVALMLMLCGIAPTH
jgi:hypothetical protein